MRVPTFTVGLSVLRAKTSTVSSYFIPNFHQPCHGRLLLIRPTPSNICQQQLHNNDHNSEMSTAAGANETTQTQIQLFGKFQISPTQIFYTSPSSLTIATVNLRPIVPGHVLILPKRVAPRLSDLTPSEHADLWSSVRTVQAMLERHYHRRSSGDGDGDGGEGGGGGFNVAVQDGRVAGQSVPHVHVHILPRVGGDFERNDDVYDELEEWSPELLLARVGKGKEKMVVPEDGDRKDRTVKDMEDEAQLYRDLLGAAQGDGL